MISSNLISIIPEKIIRKYNVIPIEMKGERLILASEEDDFDKAQDLSILTGKRVQLVKYPKDYIEREIEATYGSTIDIDEDYARKIFDEILFKAIEDNASDIHIEPFDNYLLIRFRVDGKLYEAFRYTFDLHESLTAVIKLQSKIDITEKRIPQDGRIDVNLDGMVFDIRTSTIPTTYGEKIVLRLLNRNNFFKTEEEIGFSAKAIDIIHNIISQNSGILIITGPTGSGKSTTLYSILNYLNCNSKNIITIENPVEYKIDGINQIQVNEKVGLSFETGLRAILRQDPDIIMIGEIRDLETAEIAVRASITGHLVLTTLHTNDSVSTITRLTDMGVEPYMIAASLKGVVSQRLVRKKCTECENGCEKCNYKGYKGRTIVYEILEIDDEIREAINKSYTLADIRTLAIKRDKIITFDECYRLLARTNVVDRSEKWSLIDA